MNKSLTLPDLILIGSSFGYGIYNLCVFDRFHSHTLQSVIILWHGELWIIMQFMVTFRRNCNLHTKILRFDAYIILV